MIKSIQFPGKQFESKEDLFKELRENADKIIACKKANIYESHTKNAVPTSFVPASVIDKGITVKTGPQLKEGFVYPIMNTTNYFDSHEDVHFDGTFVRSAKDQNGKLFYVTDHIVSVDTIIAWPQDVKVMVKDIPWSWVNKNYDGTTQAVMYEIEKKKIRHNKALEIINDNLPIQNSVRMQYIVIKLGMNSDNPLDKEAKAYYDLRISQIVNRDEVDKIGYFFGVEEAALRTEGSMVPLGSNDATSVQQRKDEADTITSEHKDEPVIPTTQTKQYFFNANII